MDLTELTPRVLEANQKFEVAKQEMRKVIVGQTRLMALGQLNGLTPMRGDFRVSDYFYSEPM
jgi:hypothetical protein